MARTSKSGGTRREIAARHSGFRGSVRCGERPADASGIRARWIQGPVHGSHDKGLAARITLSFGLNAERSVMASVDPAGQSNRAKWSLLISDRRNLTSNGRHRGAYLP